jgi:NitT/TauT family transport system substrate-binding protein
MKRRRRIIALAIMFVAVLSVACASAVAQTAKQKVSLAVAADSLQYSLMYFAIDGGGFAREGLEPEATIFDSGTRQSAAIISGGADFGPIGLIHAMKASAAGGSLVAVSRLFDVLDLYLVLSNDAVKKTGIAANMPIDEKIRRLKGLRLGITGPGSTVDTGVRSLFMARGMDPDQDVQLQPLGAPSTMIAALEKGLTDGFAYPAPYPSIAAERGLGQVVVDPFVDQIPEVNNVPYLVLVTGGDTLAKKPELVAKVTRAFAWGIKLAHDDPDAARRIVAKHLPDLGEKLMNALWPSYRKGIPDSTVITTVQFEATQKWLNLTSKPPVSLRYDEVVSAAASQQAAKDILGK